MPVLIQELKNVLRRLIGPRPYRSLQCLLKPRHSVDEYGAQRIEHDPATGGSNLHDALRRGAPFAAGKIGASELRAWIEAVQSRIGTRENLSASILYELHLHSGVFPPDASTVSRFIEVYEQAARQMDCLAAWFMKGEGDFIVQHAPTAELVSLYALEPYLLADPWTAALTGKRVVVVSPFFRSIESQYARRREVWKSNPAVLPDFELRTVRAPLSDFLSKSPFPDWFAALDSLKQDLSAKPFDIALIGAGAFSLPLAAHAKQAGAIGLHLGGATQILFGIRGRRWDDHDLHAHLPNSAWVRPSAEERPPAFERMEGGCYW